MNHDFILPTNKKALMQHMIAAGLNPKEGFAELARTGTVRLSAEVRATYCNHRYNLVDEGSRGGANVASYATPDQRQIIPAAQPDADGTFAQRQAAAAKDLNEQTKQEQFRRRFLSL